MRSSRCAAGIAARRICRCPGNKMMINRTKCFIHCAIHTFCRPHRRTRMAPLHARSAALHLSQREHACLLWTSAERMLCLLHAHRHTRQQLLLLPLITLPSQAKSALESRKQQRQRMDELMRRPQQPPLPPSKPILRKGARCPASTSPPRPLPPRSAPAASGSPGGGGGGSPERREALERQRRAWREELQGGGQRQRAGEGGGNLDGCDAQVGMSKRALGA